MNNYKYYNYYYYEYNYIETPIRVFRNFYDNDRFFIFINSI